MWKYPWKYAEGWAICAGLFLTGAVLQLLVGKIDTGLFRYPANLLIGGLYLIALAGIHGWAKREKALRWFSGLEAAVTSLSALLMLVLTMGLTRQVASVGGDTGLLGFGQMTTSWPFVLLFFYFLSVVGLVTLRRLVRWGGGERSGSGAKTTVEEQASGFRKPGKRAEKARFSGKEIGFFLNHAGLFITLWAAILGSGDVCRLRMNASLNAPEWRATDEQNRLVELPLAIELKSFRIETYPPKLMVIDNTTGKVLPEDQPMHGIAEANASVTLLDWEVCVSRVLPMAACVMSTDTVNFVEFHSEGATTAVYVEAVNRNDGTRREGWISCGNYMFPYVTLELDASHSVVMPDLEPRRYVSEVQIYTKDKQTHPAVIEVNKPLALNGWKIYQLSYDERMGAWSRTSVFELVKDPWLPVVYFGIGLMLAGAVCLFVTAPGVAKPSDTGSQTRNNEEQNELG